MNNKNNPQKRPLHRYAQFSNVAFQMAATIVLFVLFGKYLDRVFNNSKPIFVAILSIFGVFLAIFNLIKKVSKMK